MLNEHPLSHPCQNDKSQVHFMTPSEKDRIIRNTMKSAANILADRANAIAEELDINKAAVSPGDALRRFAQLMRKTGELMAAD